MIMKFSKINNKQKGNVLRASKGNALSLSKGFTLIELLVVIGILAVLLAITLIAINPARQFSQANNTKRTSDVNAILNAINQYMADNAGNTPTGITAAELNIAKVGGADICSQLMTIYMAALPSDPKTGVPNGSVTNCAQVDYDTKYSVIRSGTDNRVTVKAVAPELGATISVTR